MRLRVVDLDRDPEARSLVFRQWSELCERYGVPAPCGEEGALPTGSFTEPVGAFLVGEVDGVAVACGGVRPCQEARPGVGEIKRMYVDPSMRGRGLGRVLLAALEEQGRRLGYERLWLETGTAQPEAMHLYVSGGWTPIPKYGEYEQEEDSRCFERLIAERSSSAAS